jgi:hypothetical protein
MKRILSLVILFFCQYATSQTVIPFEKKGVIFYDKYEFYMFNDLKRFTPSLFEIKELERLLSQQIKFINQNKPNQNHQPLIHRNLGKYKRQYIGFYNEIGERIIYINFLWKGYKDHDLDGNEIEPWKTEWLQIFDGGSHYWQIKYNPELKMFFDFSVNGVA